MLALFILAALGIVIAHSMFPAITTIVVAGCATVMVVTFLAIMVVDYFNG